MDQGPLVTEQIDAGSRLIKAFDRYAPVQAAFWVKEGEDGQWFLYLASDRIDDSNFDLAYGEVIRLLGTGPHLWLDPNNGAVIATGLATVLGEADPANADAYAANARAFAAEMKTLSEDIADTLAPVHGRRFIVFHDAYQYFEHRFDLRAAASVVLQDGVAPGAARVRALRELIRSEDVACAFAEPQFEPRLLAALTEGTDVRTATLDPLDPGLAPGPSLYPELLTNIATSLATCLGS